LLNILWNFVVVCVRNLPEIIGGNLMKFWQKQFCTVCLDAV